MHRITENLNLFKYFLQQIIGTVPDNDILLYDPKREQEFITFLNEVSKGKQLALTQYTPTPQDQARVGATDDKIKASAASEQLHLGGRGGMYG